MNITKRTKSEGTTVYQFRVFLSQSADGKQRTRSKTWQPPAGMTAKAAEKEAKRQAVIFENEVKQGRAALDARTKLSDVAREYIRNTEIRNGCDLMLKNYDVATNHLTDTTSATSVKAMRQACKNIMYTVVNSRVYDPANTVSTPIWRTAMIVVDVLLAVLLVVLEVLTFKSYKKKKAQ